MTMHGRAEAVEEEAAKWIARRMGSIGPSEQEHEFASWLAASTAHRIAYLRLETAWRQSERLKELPMSTDVPNSLVDPSDAARIQSTDQAKSRAAIGAKQKRWTWALAASLIIVSSAWMLFRTGGENYSTVTGQTRRVSMNDGTLVTMDTKSHLKIDDASGHRAVYLYEGEALFNVVHDNSRPFSVNVGNFQITDIGTRFILRLDGDETRLAVLEGRVRLHQTGFFNSAPSREISAGTQAVIRHDQIDDSALSDEEALRLVSWVDGYIEFKDAALADVIREFNRYNVQQLLINDPHLNIVRLGGRFKYSDLAGFVTLLQRGFGVTVVNEGEQIKLSLR